MKRNIVEGLGAFTPSTWAEIRSLVDSKEGVEIQRSQNRTPPVFYAKITEATKVSGIARWKYQWVQVVRKANTSAFADSMFDTLSGGRNSDAVSGGAIRYAVNLFEVANTSVLAYGMAVTTDGVALQNADTYDFEPVPLNTIVEMRLTRDRGGVISPTFSAPNPIDGDCPTPDSNLINGGTF